MRGSLRTLGILLVAGAAGWFVRGVDVREPAETLRSPGVIRAEPPAAGDDVVVRVQRFALPGERRGSRDVFAYVEAPVFTPPPAPVQRPPVIAPAVTVERVSAVASPPQPPVFPFRFIGVFGTRDVRIAAFSRDGEVITVRAGDRIGSGFVLRSIGVESVEVYAIGWERSPQRVPLEVAGG